MNRENIILTMITVVLVLGLVSQLGPVTAQTIQDVTVTITGTHSWQSHSWQHTQQATTVVTTVTASHSHNYQGGYGNGYGYNNGYNSGNCPSYNPYCQSYYNQYPYNGYSNQYQNPYCQYANNPYCVNSNGNCQYGYSSPYCNSNPYQQNCVNYACTVAYYPQYQTPQTQVVSTVTEQSTETQPLTQVYTSTETSVSTSTVSDIGQASAMSTFGAIAGIIGILAAILAVVYVTRKNRASFNPSAVTQPPQAAPTPTPTQSTFGPYTSPPVQAPPPTPTPTPIVYRFCGKCGANTETDMAFCRA